MIEKFHFQMRKSLKWLNLSKKFNVKDTSTSSTLIDSISAWNYKFLEDFYRTFQNKDLDFLIFDEFL